MSSTLISRIAIQYGFTITACTHSVLPLLSATTEVFIVLIAFIPEIFFSPSIGIPVESTFIQYSSALYPSSFMSALKMESNSWMDTCDWYNESA